MYRKLISLAALAVVVAAISGIGYAAIPGSNGVISACKKSDGSIKLIDKEAGQGCASNQQLVEWNQQGPAGEPGSALAYAYVSPSGYVTDSLNITAADVTKPAGTYGVYCFSGLPSTAKNVQVTLGNGIGGGAGLLNPIPAAMPGSAPCPAGTQFLVSMQDPNSTSFGGRDHAFYVRFE